MPEIPAYDPSSETNEGGERQAVPHHYSLEIFAAYHGTKEEFAKLDQKFAHADVVVPEIVWGEADLVRFWDLSQGEREPIDDGSAYGHFETLLYKSNKPVMLVDVPFGHDAYEKYYPEATEAIKETSSAFVDGDYERATTSYKRAVELHAQGSLERERHMAERLNMMIPMLPDRFPQLMDKSEINILMPIGATHTTLFHDLTRNEPSGVSVKMSLGESPIVFDTTGQIERELKMRRPVAEETWERGLISSIIEAQIESLIPSDTERSKTEMRILKHIKAGEAKELSLELGQIAEPADKTAYITSKIVAWLDRAIDAEATRAK